MFKTEYKGIPRRDALARLRKVKALGTRGEMKVKEDIDKSRGYMDCKDFEH